MNFRKNVLAGFALVIGSGLVAQNFVALNSGNVVSNHSNVMRSIAQAAGVSFQDVVSHYREHVNQTGIIVADYHAMAEAFADLHLNSPQRSGGLVLMNNIGASDASYLNHDQIKNLAQQEIIREAIELKAKFGGGTIAVVAGNTNTGVGLVVTAAQESAFVERVLTQYNVQVRTGGLSSSTAILSHGADYSKGYYGSDFMNTKLDVTAAILTPPGVWTVLQNGISQVAKLTVYFKQIVTAKGVVNVKSKVTIREGGPITAEEGPQTISELERLAKEQGVHPKQIAEMTLQQGLEAGTQLAELKANKGNAGVTDLLIAMLTAGNADASVFKSMEAMGIRLERYQDGKQIFAGELTKESLTRTVEAVLSSEKGRALMARSKAYTDEIRKIDPKAENAKQKIYEIDTRYGILVDELPYKHEDPTQQKPKNLSNLVNEIKALRKSGGNADELKAKEAKLEAHRQGARLRAFSNSALAYLNTVNNLSRSYRANSESAGSAKEKASLLEASQRLAKTFAMALAVNKLEVVGGSTVRSQESEVKKMVERAKR